MSKAKYVMIWRAMLQNKAFYFFISPFLFLFLVFGLYPLLFSLYLSFVKWDGLTQPNWIGLGNFVAMLDDDILVTSLWNTFVIGFLYVPPMLIAAFLFASLLNLSWLKLRGVFRAAFFLPAVTPMVALSVVFGLLYGVETGFFNHLLTQCHLPAVPWLVSEHWSKVSVAILVFWRWTGYNMILMLAGLQGIDPQLYEAASIDGVNGAQRLRHITFPLMMPVFVFCGIMSLIGTVYMFDEVFVLTRGGPGTSSTTFGLYLFNASFQDFKFGYASAMAYVVAFFVFLVSLLILKWRKGVES